MSDLEITIKELKAELDREKKERRDLEYYVAQALIDLRDYLGIVYENGILRKATEKDQIF